MSRSVRFVGVSFVASWCRRCVRIGASPAASGAGRTRSRGRVEPAGRRRRSSAASILRTRRSAPATSASTSRSRRARRCGPPATASSCSRAGWERRSTSSTRHPGDDPHHRLVPRLDRGRRRPGRAPRRGASARAAAPVPATAAGVLHFGVRVGDDVRRPDAPVRTTRSGRGRAPRRASRRRIRRVRRLGSGTANARRSRPSCGSTAGPPRRRRRGGTIAPAAREPSARRAAARPRGGRRRASPDAR